MASTLPSLPSRGRVAAAVRRRVRVDYRALATLRILLGTLLVVDLARRSRNLVAFYTDAGVLPRAALFSDYRHVVSLHAISGEAWVQGLLFTLAGVAAVALAVGYRTRVATAVSWALLVSLHARNPMVLNGGDILFRLLLLWGVFLPLGARWSLDARLRAGDPTGGRPWVASVATAGLLCQVLFVYLTNAVHKAAGDAWLNGEAIAYVLSLDQFTVLLGDTLAEYHLLLRLLTHVWFVLLWAAPLLVLSAGRLRTALAVAFVGMHLGMAVTMRLGLFPAVMVAALVPFFQTEVWDAALGRLAGTATGQRVDGWLTRLDRRLPGQSARVTGTDGGHDHDRDRESGPDRDRLAAARSVVATGVPLVLLVVVVLANAAAVGLPAIPEEAEPAVDATGVDQHWRMFAPDPLGADGWYVVPGTLMDGSTVDVFHGGSVEWDRPARLEDAYPTARWRKYLSNVRWSGNTNHRSYLAAYLCDRWNRTHDSDVETVSVYYMEQESRPFAASEPIERRHLHEHDCSGPLRQ